MPHRIASPPQAGAAGDWPITPSSARANAPDRPSHRPRPAWARATALCAAPVTIALPAKRPRAAIKPVPCAAPDRRQPSNPHKPQRRARPPRVPCMGPWLSSPYFTAGLTSFRVSWFDLEARFFVPTRRSRTLARAGAVKIGCRSSLSPSSVKSFPKLRSGEAASLRPRARWHAGGGRDDASRGARRSRRDVHRTTTLYSVGQETRTMMQSCASVAKLRSGGPILPFGIAAIEHPPDARHLEPSSATCFHARRIREQSQALLLMTPGEGQGRRERRLLGRDATAQSAAFVRVPRSSSCANRASRLFAPRTIAPAHCPSGT